MVPCTCQVLPPWFLTEAVARAAATVSPQVPAVVMASFDAKPDPDALHAHTLHLASQARGEPAGSAAGLYDRDQVVQQLLVAGFEPGPRCEGKDAAGCLQARCEHCDADERTVGRYELGKLSCPDGRRAHPCAAEA